MQQGMRHKGKRIYIRNDRHDALACKNGAAYMYTATFTCRCEKKCVYDERGDKRCFFFSPPSFCLYRAIRYWFSLPITNVVVAVRSTAFWFGTTSVRRIGFRRIPSKDDSPYPPPPRIHTPSDETVLVDRISARQRARGDGGGGGGGGRHTRVEKGGFIVVFVTIVSYLFIFIQHCIRFFFSPAVNAVTARTAPAYFCECLYARQECGVGSKVDYKPFGPVQVRTHRGARRWCCCCGVQTPRPRFVRANLTRNCRRRLTGEYKKKKYINMCLR